MEDPHLEDGMVRDDQFHPDYSLTGLDADANLVQLLAFAKEEALFFEHQSARPVGCS